MSVENDPSQDEEPKEDLDAFLIEVESKLRAPFSSLDLAKAVTTTALRLSSPRRYLQLISKVLPRMDKVIQLRVLVGMLGLEPSQETNEVVYSDILTQEQEEVHEEWVRVVAGLVRGIMFYDPENDEDCRGEEARSLLEKTCKDIVKRVRDREAETDKKDTDASLLWTADMDPLFAPYRYSLLDTKILEKVIPECQSNPHFNVNEDADILSFDQKAEDAKAIEEQREQEQKKARAVAAQKVAATKPAATAQTAAPGNKAVTGRPTSTTASGRPRPTAPKSSMFLPSKKPTMGAQGRLGRQLANMRKTPIRARKPGSAQALVAKNRRPGGSVGAAATLRRNADSAGATAGRAMKYGNNKSKMKMIDVAEVQGLTREQKEREDKETQEQKMSARKRKILEKAKGLKKAKTNDTNGKPAAAPAQAPPAAATNSVPEAPAQQTAQSGAALQATAAAALLAYQQQTTGSVPGTNGNNAAPSQQVNTMKPTETPAMATPLVAPQPPAPAAPPVAASGAAPPKQDWRQLLEKSNKLSGEDRFRIKQFFVDKFNPTPDVPTYRIKLHEEKTADASGQTVKETLYLELDYNTFGFKKLRKTKKK